jgi:hypothetical protein
MLQATLSTCGGVARQRLYYYAAFSNRSIPLMILFTTLPPFGGLARDSLHYGVAAVQPTIILYLLLHATLPHPPDGGVARQGLVANLFSLENKL